MSQAKTSKLNSVGAKMAIITIAVFAVVTVFAYFMLTAHEREGLLRAKESAAVMVTELFERSEVFPLEFEDEDSIKAAVDSLAQNSEVYYVGIWAPDTMALEDGAIKQAAEYRKEGLAQAPSVTSLEQKEATRELSANWLTVTQPILNEEGATLGVAKVVFSLERENALIAASETRILSAAVLVSGGLTFLLMLLIRRIISSPLARLTHATHRLEKGEHVDIEVGSRDEIGTLATSFAAMADAIRDRDEKLQRNKRDMRLILDNAGQGFLTLDREGRVSEERSAIVTQWLGHGQPDEFVWEFLGRSDADMAVWMQMGWETVTDDFLPLELALDQLPKKMVVGEEQHYQLEYKPVFQGEVAEKFVLVMTDITSEVERLKMERTQRELTNVFDQVVRNKGAFLEFFQEARRLVSKIEHASPENLKETLRDIHTLKGNCGIFGIVTVADFCHEVETRLAESGGGMREHETKHLRKLWDDLTDRLSSIVRPDRARAVLELRRSDLETVLAAARSGKSLSELEQRVTQWTYEPVEDRFRRIAEQAKSLAAQLGRGNIGVEIVDSGIRLPPQQWAEFWSNFAHVIRNSVDHGLETLEEREASGKSGPGTLRLTAQVEDDHYLIEISDNGRGVNWAKLSQKAKEAGLPSETEKDLVEAIFHDGLSTADQLSNVSGRGVGMGAVRQTCREMGGEISVRSQAGEGTTFAFRIPRTPVQMRASA